MKIILVGGGKVGTALARQLSEEGHSVTVIDTSKARVEQIVQAYDVLGVVGNGSSIATLSEAGIEDNDVFIAITGSDELNLLCCMFAEMTAATEISRLLRFPGASKIDTFAGGRVQLIKFALTQAHGLDGLPIRDIPARMGCDILVCAVERGKTVTIPDGSFVLRSGDLVTFLATPDKAQQFFRKLGIPTAPVKNAMIVGGGAIAFYLSQYLLENKIKVRIIERDLARCDYLAEELPEAQVLCEDGSNRSFLLSEGLGSAEAFVALTNMDEENILLSLFASNHSQAKRVTKINRLEFDEILDSFDLGSVIYPKYMTCDFIVQYVRTLQNEAGSNIKTLYRILDDRVEALEFTVHEVSPATGIPLSELHLKPNLLLCCITRGDQIIIPRGGDTIQLGDTVIVVTLQHGLHDLRDIVAGQGGARR